MEYEDRLTVATPEGVELALSLAGLGSRFIAVVADLLLKAVIIGLGAIVLAVVGGGGVATAIFLVFAFLVFWLYDVLFEVLGAGRTPGKRWSSLRVVGEGGAPVGLRESLVRNLLRLVDGPVSVYLAGAITILLTARNQRLGDLVAGTLVLRERRSGKRITGGDQLPPDVDLETQAAYDVSSVSASDLSTVRAFLERRGTLEASARAALAEDLAKRLRAKTAGVPEDLGAEAFLEWLAAARSGGTEGASAS